MWAGAAKSLKSLERTPRASARASEREILETFFLKMGWAVVLANWASIVNLCGAGVGGEISTALRAEDGRHSHSGIFL